MPEIYLIIYRPRSSWRRINYYSKIFVKNSTSGYSNVYSEYNHIRCTFTTSEEKLHDLTSSWLPRYLYVILYKFIIRTKSILWKNFGLRKVCYFGPRLPLRDTPIFRWFLWVQIRLHSSLTHVKEGVRVVTNPFFF